MEEPAKKTRPPASTATDVTGIFSAMVTWGPARRDLPIGLGLGNWKFLEVRQEIQSNLNSSANQQSLLKSNRISVENHYSNTKSL